MQRSRAIRAVAIFEASKGAIIIVAATGLLSVHKGLYAIAARLIEHSYLNPASKYPQIFLDAAARLQDSRLLMLALGAAAYSTVRFIEAYGLFRERAWAEFFAAGAGSIYVPFELFELYRNPTWHGAALLVLNLLVVAVMVNALLQRRKAPPGIWPRT